MKLEITPASHALFMAYAKDAGNWSGSPLVGGNVDDSKAAKGNLTHLKKLGLVTTEQDSDNSRCHWLTFTDAGIAYAKLHGIELQS